MFFLFSGEGPTDCGVGMTNGMICEGDAFLHGPMTVIADQIVEGRHHYSPLEAGCCGFTSEHRLAERASALKAAKKRLRLPGKKQAKETRYFFNNARVLSWIAKEKQKELKDDVVAVLFRDSDGTASAGRGLWEDKRQSMLDGFEEERFSRGVPMIPRPKSEAWLICALKRNRACESLESRSGNDNSPHSLKAELNALLGAQPSREKLCDLVNEKKVDINKITMPSFDRFRARLEDVI
jgi:hypothetical protein